MLRRRNGTLTTHQAPETNRHFTTTHLNHATHDNTHNLHDAPPAKSTPVASESPHTHISLPQPNSPAIFPIEPPVQHDPNHAHSPSTSFNSTHLPNRSFSLPEFWQSNAASYFKTIKVLFANNGVTSEFDTYSFLISSISKNRQVLSKVADTLQHLDFETPYSHLKNSLLDSLTDRRDESPFTLLYQCHRENDTIPEYLVRLRTLLDEHYDPRNDLLNDLLRHRTLDALDS